MTYARSSDDAERKRLAVLLEQFKHASGATTEDRSARNQLLDELQDAMGPYPTMGSRIDWHLEPRGRIQ